jgi:hypothetical protein
VATTPKTELAGPTRPLGVPEIPQLFLPSSSSKGTYSPKLYGAARVHFRDRKRKIDEVRSVGFVVPLAPGIRTVDWEGAQPTDVTPAQLLKTAPAEGAYLPLPTGAMQLKAFTRWAKNFDRWLARTQRLEVTLNQDPPEVLSLAPKRGGVSVEIVAIVWELG